MLSKCLSHACTYYPYKCLHLSIKKLYSSYKTEIVQDTRGIHCVKTDILHIFFSHFCLVVVQILRSTIFYDIYIVIYTCINLALYTTK